jgi:hypothetical protein
MEREKLVYFPRADFVLPTDLPGEPAFSFDLRFRTLDLRLPKSKFQSFTVLCSTRA